MNDSNTAKIRLVVTDKELLDLKLALAARAQQLKELKRLVDQINGFDSTVDEDIARCANLLIMLRGQS